jgi:predicted phosphodiesterase
MRLQIISDLHLEFFSSTTEINDFLQSLVCDADAIMLAGDITTPRNIEKHLHAIKDVFKDE